MDGQGSGLEPGVGSNLACPGPGGQGTVRPSPADVLFHTAETRPLAVDVTVVHHLRPSNNLAAEDTNAATQAETAKSAAQVAIYHQAGWAFSPFGVASTGGLGTKATSLIKRICRSSSMRSGEPIADILGRNAALLSVVLAKGRAEMLCRAFKPC